METIVNINKKEEDYCRLLDATSIDEEAKNVLHLIIKETNRVIAPNFECEVKDCNEHFTIWLSNSIFVNCFLYRFVLSDGSSELSPDEEKASTASDGKKYGKWSKDIYPMVFFADIFDRYTDFQKLVNILKFLGRDILIVEFPRKLEFITKAVRYAPVNITTEQYYWLNRQLLDKFSIHANPAIYIGFYANLELLSCIEGDSNSSQKRKILLCLKQRGRKSSTEHLMFLFNKIKYHLKIKGAVSCWRYKNVDLIRDDILRTWLCLKNASDDLGYSFLRNAKHPKPIKSGNEKETADKQRILVGSDDFYFLLSSYFSFCKDVSKLQSEVNHYSELRNYFGVHYSNHEEDYLQKKSSVYSNLGIKTIGIQKTERNAYLNHRYCNIQLISLIYLLLIKYCD